MTAQERQALWFLLALTALGTGVRVVRGREVPTPVPVADSVAFDHQLRAVDSALTSKRSKGKAKAGGGRKSSSSRSSVSERVATSPAELDISAFPESRSSGAPSMRGQGGRSGLTPRAEGRVDLDVASKAEIETLPWVGPALAERIVSNRTRCGPFGSIEGLKRVAGIGDGIAKRLTPLVTFSSRAHGSSAAGSPCG